MQGAGGQFRPGDGHGHRSPGLARGAGMRIGDQPAQRTVAGAVVVSVGQHDDASPDLGAEVAVVVKDRKVHPDDRIQPGRHAGLQVLDGPVQAVAVRAGERGRAVCGGRGGQFIRPGDAIVGAEGGGDMEMGEAHADSGFRRGSRASWILRRRHRPLPTCRVRSRVRRSEPRRDLPAARTWTRQISWSTRPGPLPSGARLFLRPPLAALIPADGFGADRVVPAGPVEVAGAGRRACRRRPPTR